ncbi:hypothetical protein [Dyadobacter sp. 3J3]|uniref:hypothetical protein n=1 Tax=Dyadobacter sp. 3J3 TaxID=2606600 RepID=UPI0013580792|nr:hypothetical protein [Dyadobacter sp. 3J3]
MKHFVLVFILVFFSGFYVKAQESKAREIVKLAVKKHTLDKKLEFYELKADYDKQGKVPASLTQPDPLLELIDSMMESLPDSEKVELIEAKKHMLDDFEDFWAGQKEDHFVDLTSGATALIFRRPSPLRGGMDSSKVVYYIDNRHLLIESITNNPVALLQLISTDSTELHYSGPSTIDNKDFFIVQAKVQGKWVDFYIDQKTYLLQRLTISQVDNHPLIGKGPVHYKDITLYKDYQNKAGFLVPQNIEEISSRSPVTRRKKLMWVSFNKKFTTSIFDSWPNYMEKTKCKIEKIEEGLFVMERSGDYINARSLLRVNHQGDVEMFGDLTNNDVFNKKELEAVKLEFGKHRVKNVFNVNALSGLLSLSCFFTELTHVIAPKSVGIFSEEKLSYNPKEDSMRIAVRSEGLLTTFDKEFQNEGVAALILNPIRDYENDNIWVAYYLPNEKVVYLDANPYSADKNSINVRPSEKLLYDIIKSRALKVEKIIFTGAYMNNAPLFMKFEDFDDRIKKMDLSAFEKWKKR